MVEVYWETIAYSKSVAQLLDRAVYLKGKRMTGWRLYDEPPDKPYFIIKADGQATEVRKEENEE
jgi:hypothetical protein